MSKPQIRAAGNASDAATRNAPVPHVGSTTTFGQKKIGDVHLTWENEAHLEVDEAKGALEIVYPPISIEATPPVAVVDANAKRHKTEAVAEAYMKYVFTPEARALRLKMPP